MNSFRLPAILGLAHAAFLVSHGANAGDGKTQREPIEMGVTETGREFAGSEHAARTRFAPQVRLLKLDLDADFSGDGVVDNQDPMDNGPVQTTPPGLIVGRGDVRKAVIRAYRYPKNYRGELIVTMSVDCINRRERSGNFPSLEAEIANAGGIRVWLDRDRTQLLIDSRNPDLRKREWPMQLGIPSGVPPVVYVEGVVPSQFSGDVRLILSARPVSKNPKEPNRYYDHILLTVEPHSRPDLDNRTTYFAAGRSASNR